MSAMYKTIEIHSDLKREFVDFAVEAHKRFPSLPDIRKAVLTESGNVISVTVPVEQHYAATHEAVTPDSFFEIAEDMFTIRPGEQMSDPVAWVA